MQKIFSTWLPKGEEETLKSYQKYDDDDKFSFKGVYSVIVTRPHTRTLPFHFIHSRNRLAIVSMHYPCGCEVGEEPVLVLLVRGYNEKKYSTFRISVHIHTHTQSSSTFIIKSHSFLHSIRSINSIYTDSLPVGMPCFTG